MSLTNNPLLYLSYSLLDIHVIHIPSSPDRFYQVHSFSIERFLTHAKYVIDLNLASANGPRSLREGAYISL